MSLIGTGTHNTNQAALELRGLPASPSQVLDLRTDGLSAIASSSARLNFFFFFFLSKRKLTNRHFLLLLLLLSFSLGGWNS